MKFTDFEKIVKTKYPEAEVFKHGEFAGNKINVAIVFSPTSKVYKYNGTYVDVLNRLGIKACYKHDITSVERHIEYLIKTDGEEGFFGGILDHTKEITRYKEILAEMKERVICD